MCSVAEMATMHEAPVPVGQTGQTGALHEGGVAGPVRTDNKGEVRTHGTFVAFTRAKRCVSCRMMQNALLGLALLPS